MFSLIPIRDENPHHRFPVLTVGLITANILAFFALGSSAETAFRFGAVPCDVIGECPILREPFQTWLDSRSATQTLFTSMFMHADIFHLGLNMLFLWVFGNNVEDRLGHVRFGIFYLATGLGAAAAHIGFNTASVVPVIGASGAISGVLGAYILLWPHATILSLLPIGFLIPVRTPAWLVLGIWFATQILGSLAGLGQVQGGGVAFLAHVGGFVAGLLLIVPLGGRRRRARLEPFD